MQIHATASGPAIDLERIIAALPLLWRRVQEITFDAEGRALVDDAPAERLALIDGQAWQPGATYWVHTDEAVPSVRLITNDADALTAEIEQAEDDTTTKATVRLAHPAEPEAVRVTGLVLLPAAAILMGRELSFDVDAHVADFLPSGKENPQVNLTLGSKWVTATSTGRVTAAAEGERWQVDADIELEFHGIAKLAVVATPVIRRKVTDALNAQITDALTETAASIAADFSPEAGPAEIAEAMWENLASWLHSPVPPQPADSGDEAVIID